VWSLDLAATGSIPHFTPAPAQQPAAHTSRTTASAAMPEWGPAATVEEEWDLPPVVTPVRPAYEPPPTGFESAPPPVPQRIDAPDPTENPAPPPPTIADLFGTAPAVPPPPTAPDPALPFAFLPPPNAADRADVVQPMTDDVFLEERYDADPELTMIASRRGKTKFWTLDLPDGSVEVIVGSVIVGRSATPVPGRVGARLLSIDDPTRSVSKNHAFFSDENGSLFVEDLGSMNGIMVTRVDGHETELAPGVRHRLEHGATVELGDLLLTVLKN